MKRYNITQLKNSLIQIRCNSTEEANKIWKANKQNDFWNIGVGLKEFYVMCKKNSYPTWMPDSEYFKQEYKIEKTIEFSQIDFQEELINELYIW